MTLSPRAIATTNPQRRAGRNCQALAAVALGLLALLWTPVAWADGILNIDQELLRPGVRLLAVEFYRTDCAPCMRAVPAWKRLHEKYRDRGLRFVVVSVEQDGRCTNLPWLPDANICDTEGQIAESFKVSALPQAFLWSWTGELLVRSGHVTEVEAAVDRELAKLPRVTVVAGEGSDSAQMAPLKSMVRDALATSGKIDVVAGNEDQKLLAQVRRNSQAADVDEGTRCELGQQMAANSLLKVELLGPPANRRLSLQLISAERGCLSRVGSARWLPDHPQRSAAEAATDLVMRFRTELQMPGGKSPGHRPAPRPPKPEPAADLPAEAEPAPPLQPKVVQVAAGAATFRSNFTGIAEGNLPPGWLADDAVGIKPTIHGPLLMSFKAGDHKITIPNVRFPEDFDLSVVLSTTYAGPQHILRAGGLQAVLSANSRCRLLDANEGTSCLRNNQPSLVVLKKRGNVVKLYVDGFPQGTARVPHFKRPDSIVLELFNTDFRLLSVAVHPASSADFAPPLQAPGEADGAHFRSKFNGITEGELPLGWIAQDAAGVTSGPRGKYLAAPTPGDYSVVIPQVAFPDDYDLTVTFKVSYAGPQHTIQAGSLWAKLSANSRCQLRSANEGQPCIKNDQLATVQFQKRGKVFKLLVDGQEQGTSRIEDYERPESIVLNFFNTNFYLASVALVERRQD